VGGKVWESRDGRTLIYSKGPALFAHPLAGGPDRKLVDCVRGAFGYALAETGLYYVACGSPPNYSLHRLDVASGKDRVLGALERFSGRITVFRDDEKTLLYSSVMRQGSDLMFMEGFR
jgi:hypothetical protein